jgi:regulator of cell morphogenesis and NO signaling
MSMVASESLKELCARHPLALPVLHQHGVDTSDPCRTLAASCEGHVDSTSILAEVAAEEARLAAPWQALALTELLDHIVRTYHRPFDSELGEVASAIDAASPSRGAPGHDAWSTLAHELAELRLDMEQHMAKEEQVLFPWLRGRADTAAAPIRAMQLEHSDTIQLLHAIHATLLQCLEAGPQGPRAEAVASQLQHVERWLCEHIHLESNELFPRALETEPRR